MPRRSGWRQGRGLVTPVIHPGTGYAVLGPHGLRQIPRIPRIPVGGRPSQSADRPTTGSRAAVPWCHVHLVRDETRRRDSWERKPVGERRMMRTMRRAVVAGQRETSGGPAPAAFARNPEPQT